MEVRHCDCCQLLNLLPSLRRLLTNSTLQVKEAVFRKSVWPVLQEQVAPGPAQSLLVYHILLVCEERFPSIVTANFLKETLTVPRVLSIATVSPLLSALKVQTCLVNRCETFVQASEEKLGNSYRFITGFKLFTLK